MRMFFICGTIVNHLGGGRDTSSQLFARSSGYGRQSIANWEKGRLRGVRPISKDATVYFKKQIQ